MPVSLDPQAQNMPSGLLARVRNTRRRIEFLDTTPTQAQTQALGSVLTMEVQEAYRLALQREAGKFGINLYGELSPTTMAALESYAQGQATTIVSTYLKNQATAQTQGKDLQAWREHYASWKAPQIMQYEYARADAQAVNAFYANSRTPEGKLLEAQGRVLPLHTAVDDNCRVWVAQGWMPLDEALPIMAELPWHSGCPHFMYLIPGSSLVNTDDPEDSPDAPADPETSPETQPISAGPSSSDVDHPSYTDSEVGRAMSGSYPQGDPAIFLPNTVHHLSLPGVSLHTIHPALLLGTLFTAGLLASVIAAHHSQSPPEGSQP